MFFRYNLLFYISCWVIFAGCGNKPKYPYAIGDFPRSLQAYLRNVITTGVAGTNEEAEQNIAIKFSNAELRKLARSEHPVLRAVALRLLLQRDYIDHQSLILSHLDDTALISIDYGEWGYMYTTVADDVLEHGTWKTEQEKEVIVTKVISEHNYLHSAYTILHRIEPKQEYYLHIKNMISRDPMFEDLERGLYLLAKYKRKEDIPLIKDKLLRKSYKLGFHSFKLMKDFPDTSYLSVLDQFERRGMGRKLCEAPDDDAISYFFETLASYKVQRAAEIISRMLYRQPLVNCYRDGRRAKRQLMEAIWDNPCPAYARMNRYIKDSIASIRKERPGLPPDRAPLPADTTGLKIYW